MKLLHFILPAVIAWTVSYILSYIMRKKGIIKDGDMKLAS